MSTNIRSLSKHAYFRKFGERSERRTGVYTQVNEDSSTEPTNKLPKEVEFRKRSIVTHRWLIVVVIMAATLMQVLDTTIVNVALPHMQGALSTTPDQISWTLTGYLVASGIFMLLTGYLSDKLGRKKLMLLSIAGFTITSALCGAAQSLTEIVIFRLLQGASGAALVPLSQAIITDIYKPEERGEAMAIWGLGIMVGPILGPTLGGFLTDISSWRWIFYVNVPIGILTFILAWRVVPKTPKHKRRLDWLGLVFIATAIASFQYFLDRGNQNDWFNDKSIKIAVTLTIVGLLSFIIHNLYKTSQKVFDINIFKDRNFTVGSLLLAALGIGLYGTMVIQPMLLENLLNYPVLTTGLVMAPRGFSSMLGMFLVGKLVNRVDPRLLVIVGIVFSASGIFFTTKYSLYINTWWVIWPLLLQGFGLGLIFVPLTVVAFSTLPANERTEASGLYSLVRTLGSSIGIAVTLAFFTRHSQMAWNQLGGFINPFNRALFQYLHPLHLRTTNLAATIVSAQLGTQSQMLTFVNTLAFIMWSLWAMLPLVFLLRYKAPTKS